MPNSNWNNPNPNMYTQPMNISQKNAPVMGMSQKNPQVMGMSQKNPNVMGMSQKNPQVMGMSQKGAPMMDMPQEVSPMMEVPKKYGPMMQMPEEQLESMYPRCYYVIHPEVCRHCDSFDSQYGSMSIPSSQQLDEMVDSVDRNVGEDVDSDYRDEEESGYDDYYGYDEYYDTREPDGFGGFGGFGGPFGGRRRFRRDLIRILFLRELLRRRRRHPHFGFPGFIW